MKTISILFANTYKVHVTSLFSIAFCNNFVIFVISDITIILISHWRMLVNIMWYIFLAVNSIEI